MRNQFEFDPVEYSENENAWLLEHLGEPPVVAMRQVPDGVNPNAVRPILQRVQELQQLQQHEGIQWVGPDVLKAAIRVWQRESEKWAHDARRGAPRWPSMFSYDAKGRPHRGGPGSDSRRVKTYFDEKGNRAPFAVKLDPHVEAAWVAPTNYRDEQNDVLFYEDATTNRFECRVPVGDGICGHTESYKSGSRQSRAGARGRMSKHLRKATENVEQHREVHTNEFGS